MQPIADGIWTVPADLRYLGLQLNTRMTVCRLSDGGLALIAPVALNEDRRATVDALGPVRAIVAPNMMHHLYAGHWMEAYPHAASFGPPGLGTKRPDLQFAHPLGPAFDDAFGEDLLHLPIAGMPRLQESLFIHRSSATLIATDFCFLMPESKGLTKVFTWAMGIQKQTRCEPLFRILIQDKEAFRASLSPLRSTTIDHLSMCHHTVLSEGAQEALRQVLDQLKVPSTPP